MCFPILSCNLSSKLFFHTKVKMIDYSPHFREQLPVLLLTFSMFDLSLHKLITSSFPDSSTPLLLLLLFSSLLQICTTNRWFPHTFQIFAFMEVWSQNILSLYLQITYSSKSRNSQRVSDSVEKLTYRKILIYLTYAKPEVATFWKWPVWKQFLSIGREALAQTKKFEELEETQEWLHSVVLWFWLRQ